LQRGHRIVAAQASREGIGQPSREEMDLSRVAAHRPRRDHFDPDGQRGRLENGHEFAKRAAFPFGRSIRGWWGHGSDSRPS
jgi:hypothetical protein